MRYEIVDQRTETVLSRVTLSTREGYLAVREQAEALGYRLDEVRE